MRVFKIIVYILFITSLIFMNIVKKFYLPISILYIIVSMIYMIVYSCAVTAECKKKLKRISPKQYDEAFDYYSLNNSLKLISFSFNIKDDDSEEIVEIKKKLQTPTYCFIGTIIRMLVIAVNFVVVEWYFI